MVSSELVGGTSMRLASASKKLVDGPTRLRINALAAFLNLCCPTIMFCGLYWLSSFWSHFHHPSAVWICYGISVLVIAICALESPQKKSWLLLTTVLLMLALVGAFVAGEINYNINMEARYSIEQLNSYTAIDPDVIKSKQIMDAGRVFFTDNTRLDLQKSMSFKHTDLYCVAPIVSSNTSYNYWAVGINCCTGEAGTFACGDYDSPVARAGLRVIKDDSYEFFRLAVNQAEATWKIKSDYPMFFYWVRTPDLQLTFYKEAGWRCFWIGCVAFFACNVLAVLGMMTYIRLMKEDASTEETEPIAQLVVDQ